MMMWEQLRLVIIGAFVAVGLTAEGLSQQAPKNRLLGLPAAADQGATGRKAKREARTRSSMVQEPAQRRDRGGRRNIPLTRPVREPGGVQTERHCLKPPCDPSNT